MSPSPRASVVISMIETLTSRDREQISQALHAQLNPRASAAQQRMTDLLPLAAMLDEQATRDGIAPVLGRGKASWQPTPASAAGSLAVERFPVVEQVRYDRLRPAGAPSGEELARRFGAWVLACRAVWGLQPDGRYSGLSKPGPTAPAARSAHRATPKPRHSPRSGSAPWRMVDGRPAGRTSNGPRAGARTLARVAPRRRGCRPTSTTTTPTAGGPARSLWRGSVTRSSPRPAPSAANPGPRSPRIRPRPDASAPSP